MPTPSSPGRPLVAALALLAVSWSGCGVAPRPPVPLLDARHGAEALTESVLLAPPGSPAANRFGAGWQALEMAGTRVLVPAGPRARLEVVHLGEEVARTLTLWVLAPLPAQASLRVRCGNRDLARLTLPGKRPPSSLPPSSPPRSPPSGGRGPESASLPPAKPAGSSSSAHPAAPAAAGAVRALEVRLPSDLPLGRLVLELELAGWGEGGPKVLGAAIAPALGRGSARVEGGDVIQSANSLVYVRHEVAPGAALAGTFVPPAVPLAGQRFELSVERPDGSPIRRFYWSPSFWNRWRGARRFELPLRGARGFVRVRLLALGGGAAQDAARDAHGGSHACRWQGLALVGTGGRELSPGL